MNERTLRVLEYDKIISRLRRHAASGLGQEAIEDLRPSSCLDEVQCRLQETSEARLIYRTEQFPLQGLMDIRAAVKRASIGSPLNPAELLNVAQVCACSRKANRFFRDRTEEYPLLARHGQQLVSLKHLEDTVSSAIAESGEVRDGASHKLQRLRTELRTAQAKVKTRIEGMLRSSTMQKYLQENIVTIRNDRYVLPVRQEYRSQVPGIIHDQSQSGATLFIEPMPIVELNNQIRQLAIAEEQEIDRILRELTEEVAQAAEQLRSNLQILTRLDMAMAMGKFSVELRAVEPALNEAGNVHLKNARHPLLPADEVVPSTIYLGQSFDVLLITGPNTGGKTVTLKTVGLLELMAMSGMHVPADEGSEIAVFHKVFADIGDEQSIEQSLSTFSSHMKNIISILEEADHQSLVLLDELGAGTDPAEGAALAMAIVDWLRSAGSSLVATTHYSQLKTYAYQTPGVQNASVEFNVQTLRPTYRLLIGLPGKSNAFEIAKGLGLSDYLIGQARTYLSGEQLKMEDMIAQLESGRRAVEAELEGARAQRIELAAQQRELERRLTEHRESLNRVQSKAKEEAATLVQRTKREMEAILMKLREAQQQVQTSNAREIASLVDESRLRMRELQEELGRPSLEEQAKKPRVVVAPDRHFEEGDEVLVKHLAQKGILLSNPSPEGMVDVQLGALRMSCSVEKLEKLVSSKPSPQKTTTVSLSRPRVSLELDLRGHMVDEALPKLDKYLDDAYVAGLNQVHVIHGKGTGVLRAAVQDFLRAHQHVKAQRPGGQGEGGSGVTVVEVNR